MVKVVGFNGAMDIVRQRIEDMHARVAETHGGSPSAAYFSDIRAAYMKLLDEITPPGDDDNEAFADMLLTQHRQLVGGAHP